MFNQISSQFTVSNLQLLVSQLWLPVLVFVVALLIFQIVRAVAYYRLLNFKKNALTQFLAARMKGLNLLVGIVTALYIALLAAPDLNLTLRNVSYVLFLVVWVWELFQFVSALISFLTDRMVQNNQKENETSYQFMAGMIKAVIFIVAVLLVLANLGYDVTSLVAGLGIGGIAVALAVQNLLGDVVSSFAIVADKPFKEGDFVMFDNFSGTVEKIGIKTTRVRSVEGEQLIITNSRLVNNILRNFSTSQFRRSVQTILVSYETDPKLLRDIPAIIGDVIQAQPKIDRATYTVCLTRFDAGGANFEITFHILTRDNKEYLEAQQEVLFAINDKLAEEKIKFQ